MEERPRRRWLIFWIGVGLIVLIGGLCVLPMLFSR